MNAVVTASLTRTIAVRTAVHTVVPQTDLTSQWEIDFLVLVPIEQHNSLHHFLPVFRLVEIWVHHTGEGRAHLHQKQHFVLFAVRKRVTDQLDSL